MDHVRSRLTVSECRSCAVVGQSRTTQRRQPRVRADEAALTEAIVRLAAQYGPQILNVAAPGAHSRAMLRIAFDGAMPRFHGTRPLT